MPVVMLPTLWTMEADWQFPPFGEVDQSNAIGGAIVETISGLAFYLYGQTTDQMKGFSRTLDQTQRYLLAISVIGSINDQSLRDQAFGKLAATLPEGPSRVI